MNRSELKSLRKQLQRPLPLLQQAESWGEDGGSSLDVNDLLGVNEHTHSYYVMSNKEWSDEGIDSGDTVIVNHRLQPSDRQLVFVMLEGSLLCKRLDFDKNQLLSTMSEPIELDEYADCHVVGVVDAVIKMIA